LQYVNYLKAYPRSFESPNSPLLSNVVLDELDKELEKGGHKLVRYADEYRINCKSLNAAQGVKTSIAMFLTGKLRIKINEEKSAASRPWLRKYLGFTFIRMCSQPNVCAPRPLNASSTCIIRFYFHFFEDFAWLLKDKHNFIQYSMSLFVLVPSGVT
jgi:Reverse transcriptase (RNA-dependent DNA polymerase)